MAGKPDESQLDPEMAERIKTGRGQMTIRGLAKYAKVEKLEYLESKEDLPDTIHHFRAKVDGGTG